VHLRRFFDEKNDHILLIDESHNLVDRARECYSASLSWEDVMQLRRVLPSGKLKGALGHLKQCVGDLQNFFVSLRKKLQSSAPDFSVFSSPPEDLINLLDAFLASAEPFLQEDTGFSAQLFSLYFSAKSFVRVAKDFDDCFRVLVKTAGSDVVIRLYCLDPASRLKKSYALCRSSVFFSATLSPSAHFQRMLGLEEARQIQIPSPFPPKNLKVLLSTSISTAYRDREKTLDALCRQIFAYYQARPGRYAVFFPSHSYLKAAHERFSELFPLVDAPCQQTCMTLEEREQFLFRFEEDRPMLAFAVMGGLFSEGVDLTGDRLEGAIIVGVGLPQPDEEQEALKDYFLSHGEDGFSHAYLYPGWIRVLQAAGRVIRTPEDRGVLLLIDPRFSHSRYVRLFPPAWEGAQRIADERSLSLALEDFWRPQAQKKE